jgi:uncharacterized repeat protein (TIGR03803 family)
MKNLGKNGGIAMMIGAVVVLLVATMTAQAQTFTTLVNFNDKNGSLPSGLVQGLDRNLYGTTYGDGAKQGGTFFVVTTTGALKTLYTFCLPSCGSSGVVVGVDGNFYGTTYYGGAYGDGTVFKITAKGQLTPLYSFCAQTNCTDGSQPSAGLVQGTDGNFYGNTTYGGDETCNAPSGCGTLFKMSPQGVFTSLHVFENTDGSYPYAPMTQASDGNFYGTTNSGGAYNNGTVYRITASGTLTTLHSFDFLVDGAFPQTGLVQASDGNLYGVVTGGGSASGYGTVFRITLAGTFATVYAFCHVSGCPDGAEPTGSLIQATDGNLYGVTIAGGGGSCPAAFAIGCGAVFQITLDGQFTNVQGFDFTDGLSPDVVYQATDGNLYGETVFGGDVKCPVHDGCGTIFVIGEGLAPFVEMLPEYGKVGSTVRVLGTDLTGATSVSFNGTAATFTVRSSSLITATVPAGATTGFVTVTSPSGTLTSNKQFRVRP